MMYYLDNDNIYFHNNDVINGSNETHHKFQFHKIAVLDKNNEEITILKKDETTVEYVTKDMLNDEDEYIIPKGEMKRYVSTLSQKRYIVDRDNVIVLYNKYNSIFKRLG